jgi:hypothetical protein
MAKILAPPDPNVKLPPAVVAAAQRSNDLVAQSLAETSAPQENGQANGETNGQANGQTNRDAVTSESNGHAPQPAPQPAPAQQIDWESRYKAMHGRFEQVNGQVRSLGQQNAHLIANMQATQPAAPNDVRFVSEKEQEEYGSEFLDVVGKRTKEVVTPEIERLNRHVQQLEARLGNVQQATVLTAKERMWAELDQKIPWWRELNENQDFIAWLALPDRYTGDIRQNLLKAAADNFLTDRVKAFFEDFLAQEATRRPAYVEPTRQLSATSSNGSPSRVDLASFAAPGRAKQPGASNFAPEEKPIITSAQIRAFYKDVSNGFFKGRDQERVAMEQAIFAAGSDGRIRN